MNGILDAMGEPDTLKYLKTSIVLPSMFTEKLEIPLGEYLKLLNEGGELPDAKTEEAAPLINSTALRIRMMTRYFIYLT
jgi:hypothetical protein